MSVATDFNGRDRAPPRGAFDGLDRQGHGWTPPQPLPDGLKPVQAFDPDMIPDVLAPWVMDVAETMNCPPEFVAVPVVVALGSVIGRKVAIRPQLHTTWSETANLWGSIIGRPGIMKSPAMKRALAPLYRLEEKARARHRDDMEDYGQRTEAFKIEREVAQKKARKAAGEGNSAREALSDLVEPEEPPAKRYIVTDVTYEALGAILAENPNGVCFFRDEITTFLKTLDREENVAGRGFMLTAWSGNLGYTFDRIGRGKTHIEAACVSLLGSTQPGRLAEYIRGTLSGGAADDGLVQRIGLLVWPDQKGDWHNIDRPINATAQRDAFQAFERLDSASPEDLGAESDEFERPFLRFDPEALEAFVAWRTRLEIELQGGELHPAIESHFAKYRKLVPSLALINHLADGGRGSVTELPLQRAIAFADYLKTHALRAYGAGMDGEATAAKAIVRRVGRGDLADNFTAREIYRKQWAGLSDQKTVASGLELLTDLGWLRSQENRTTGRSIISFTRNPMGAWR